MMSQAPNVPDTRSIPAERRRESFDSWRQREGIPVHTGLFVQDVKTLDLGPWKRLGGRGAYVRLDGAEDQTGMYVAEIPPKGALEPEAHLFEAVVYVLAGQGCTEFW